MATYAAFKHVELHKVGHGKNRVPTAPRGCISEIFSGADSPAKRHVNGNGTSNGNGVSTVDSPVKRQGRTRDTHSRLFGGGPLPTPPPAVYNDNTRSHIQFGDSVDAPQPRAAPQMNGHANGLANGHIATPKKGEGNPVTGDGYKSLNGEINTSVTALNGNQMPINHNRIPPGGYSSGLW